MGRGRPPKSQVPHPESERKEFPWFRFIIFAGLICLGVYLALTEQPDVPWFDITLPAVALTGIIYFTGRALR